MKWSPNECDVLIPVHKRKGNVVIRADASTRMGIGHIMRCLTLANMLMSEGFSIYFVCSLLPDTWYKKIVHSGHKVILIKSNQCGNDKVFDETDDIENTLSAIGTIVWRIIIVDHYQIGLLWERKIRQACEKIMVIDDLANRQHDCDILLDQTLDRTSNEYDILTPSHCQLITGTDYALLREEFYTIRQQQKNTSKASLKKILITLGGSNQTVIIVRILTALNQIAINSPPNDTYDITLVSGGSDINEINIVADTLNLSLAIMASTNDMAALMDKSDLVIGAGGSSTWERCCLGVPSIVVVLADNQRQTAMTMVAKKAAFVISSLETLEDELIRYIRTIMLTPEILISMSKKASSLVDGLGARRVVKQLIAL